MEDPMTPYPGNHLSKQDRECLQLAESILDAGTIRHLEALGVGPGWRCLEVGAGTGSIAKWLCRRVGPGGRVVATVSKTEFLQPLQETNLEIRTDIGAGDLETGAFDLVHSRLLLQHLPDREAALERMTAALAPDGVLLEEDMDCSSIVAAGQGWGLFHRAVPALIEVLRETGYVPDLGRELPGLLRTRGFRDVGAEGRVPIAIGDDGAARMWRLTIERCRPRVLERNLLSEEEFDRLVNLHDNEDFSFHFPVIVAAWGRRPLNPT